MGTTPPEDVGVIPTHIHFLGGSKLENSPEKAQMVNGAESLNYLTFHENKVHKKLRRVRAFHL